MEATKRIPGLSASGFLVDECFGKRLQFIGADFGNRPMIHAGGIPAEDFVTALCRLVLETNGSNRLVRRTSWPDKKADVVLPALIDQCGRRMSGDVIEPPANDFKSARGQIRHGGREVHLAF